MSIQVNEARDQWIRYLINFTEVWGKIIETIRSKEAEHYCARIVNIIQELRKLDQQWYLDNSVPEIQHSRQSSYRTLQGA